MKCAACHHEAPEGSRFCPACGAEVAIEQAERTVSDGRYDTYSAKLSSYPHLNDPLVLAWEVNACSKEGRVPLWDTCRLSLRGFPVTQYLSMQ